jgi:hypothetical protein
VRTLFLLSPSYVTWAPLPVNREREREVLPELIDGRLPGWLYCRSRRTRTAAARGRHLRLRDRHAIGAHMPASRVVDGARVGYMSY